jgi:hypothetical protein
MAQRQNGAVLGAGEELANGKGDERRSKRLGAQGRRKSQSQAVLFINQESNTYTSNPNKLIANFNQIAK